MDIRKEINDWFVNDTFINRYLWELHDTLNGVSDTELRIESLKDEFDGKELINLLILNDSNQAIKLQALKDLYQLYKDNV